MLEIFSKIYFQKKSVKETIIDNLLSFSKTLIAYKKTAKHELERVLFSTNASPTWLA